MYVSTTILLYTILFNFAGICCIAALPKESLTAPTFSKTYTVKGTLYIPYAEIREPFYAWYNGNSGSSRIDYYGGNHNNLFCLFVSYF